MNFDLYKSMNYIYLMFLPYLIVGYFRRNLTMTMNGTPVRQPEFVWCWWQLVAKTTSFLTFFHSSPNTPKTPTGGIATPLSWHSVSYCRKDNRHGIFTYISICILHMPNFKSKSFKMLKMSKNYSMLKLPSFCQFKTKIAIPSENPQFFVFYLLQILTRR